jgi:hypothetical protein
MRSWMFVPALLAMAGTAVAQTAPKPPETVTVVGRRPTDAEMVAQIVRQFVEIHAARSRKSGLITRAAPSGICPVTLGLPQQYDDFVTQRIVSVAEEIGSRAEEPGKCLANVEVLFTDDPQALVTKLAEETDGLIVGLHFAHERGSVIHVYRPVQAWYVTGTKRDPNAQSHTLVNGESVGPGVTVDTAYGPSPYTGTGSRIRVRNSGQIVNALIVADMKKVSGEEIGPIADYVSLLALSQPASFDGCNALPSILDRMSSGCPGRDKPKALTESDIAYLKALYSADIAISGYTAQENVAKDMDKNLGAQKP